MFWLWFTLALLFIAAVDGYRTRARVAHKTAGGAASPAAPADAAPGAADDKADG